MDDIDHKKNAPKQQEIIERRVASGIPVAHCLKCGWWIADGATAGNVCPECDGGSLRVWRNADTQRKIE